MNDFVSYEDMHHWEVLLGISWPPFYEVMQSRGSSNWKSLYELVLTGVFECFLEVFSTSDDWARTHGLAGAKLVVPAKLRWNQSTKAYVDACNAVSSYESPDLFETTTVAASGVRFCPAAVRSSLHPQEELKIPQMTEDVWNIDVWEERGRSYSNTYPHRVLPGIDEFITDQGIEFQWKRHLSCPLSWRFGILRSIKCDQTTGLADAHISFPDFDDSAGGWRSCSVVFGDGLLRTFQLGGFSGGVRGLTQHETHQWNSLLRRAPARGLTHGEFMYLRFVRQETWTH